MGDYWVFGNYESQLNDDWLSTESEYIKRKTLARTRRLSMSSLASASPISVPSASPLLSVPSGQSSPSISSQDSATDITEAVRKLFRKDKGFAGRFSHWQLQSANVSLCVFYHVELTAFLSNQSLRTEAYQLQEENLCYQYAHLGPDYATMFSAQQYPSYIGDISTCLHLVQEAERQSLSERRKHIARILKALKAENEAGNALLQRLRPYLPSQHSRRGRVLADLHDGPPTPKRSPSSSPSPDIPPPPSLTIPSSSPASTSPSSRSTSPDPTHLEVYSTSLNHTSTFSGTFSITLTLDPLSSGHAKADVIEDSPDSDVAGDDPHARTAYPLGLTDIPAAGSSPDSDTDSDTASKDPLPYTGSPSVSSSSTSDAQYNQDGDEGYLRYGEDLRANEDYDDWPQEGCPDGPYQFDADSDPDSESNWMC